MKMKTKNYQWMLVAFCVTIGCMTMLSSCGDDEEEVKKEITERTGTIGGHDYVNLGLPSGTLWATCNIGSNKPEDWGDYFAWGETSGYKAGKTDFSWKTYTYSGNSTELPISADAAYVNWGKQWRMPTLDQFEELCNSKYTKKSYIVLNGVNGLKITSKTNGNSIFLPSAGYYDGTQFKYIEGTIGEYWTRTLAYYLSFDYFGADFYQYESRQGKSVRPVLAFQ